MKCPKCKTVDLNKSSYKSPYLCSECGGMWHENPDNSVLPDITTEDNANNQNIDDLDKNTGVCPSGHGVMIRAKVDIDEPFYLEKCTACGGIWFDKGEWRRIAENNLVDSLSNIWSKSWQRKQSKENNRDNFLEMNRKLLGDDIYNSIIALSKKLNDHPEKSRAIALLQQEIT